MKRTCLKGVSVTALWVTVLGGCGGLPAWSADPTELPSLQGRVESLPTDSEARLRLAGLLWESGQRVEARAVLADGLSAQPGHPSLLAFEARAAQLSGDYLVARAAYLEGASRSTGTPLGVALAQSVIDLGPTSAPALAELVMSGRGRLDHGGAPLQTAVIARLTVAGGAAGNRQVGTALTELLVHDLRRAGPFSLVDRSLGAEVSDPLGTLPAGESARGQIGRIATLLDVGHVVWGSVTTTTTGDVSAQLFGFRLEAQAGVISQVDFEVPASEISSLRRRIAEAAWALMVGGAPGSEVLSTLQGSPGLTLEELRLLGQGLIQGDGRDHESAAQSLSDLAQQRGDLNVVRALAERERRLRDVTSSRGLGLESEALGLAQQMRTSLTLRSASPLALLPRSPSINEMFGQDRLGFQHLADFIIRVGDGS